MRAINDDEKLAFRWLTGGGDDVALAAIEFDGEETAAIVMVDRDDDDGVLLLPVAVLVPPDRWFDRMTPATAEDGVPPTRVRRDEAGVYQPVDEAAEASHE
jgi:hypothetical protein